LLDIGCGYGFFLKMAEERGWEAVGVDLDPKGIAYSKECLHVNALLGDLKDVRFPNSSFDLVTLWNVLDHIPDPLDLISEIHRVLKEDGYVFIRTPNSGWQYLSFRSAKILRRLGWGKVFDDQPYSTFIFHQTNFSAPTLRLLFNHSGFIPLSIKNSPPIPGDPYLGLGPAGELLVVLGKRAVHAAAQGLAFLSRGRWLIGPSLEAWGRREKIPDSLVAVRREPAQGKGRTEECR
jgi:SAM-dependent methyltransferase